MAAAATARWPTRCATVMPAWDISDTLPLRLRQRVGVDFTLKPDKVRA
jgi:hypothetical protein